eukprot:TRINITY_DN27920_c0_g1_i1.p1 TRINITY_DN27920_c0_g1~~TRINITY_DN27920_c0_g1_i1.p1  ORF type:complete len:269 (+),score=116.85 TRINITY_DN27920_c0_g1_i1:50-856(+)
MPPRAAAALVAVLAMAHCVDGRFWMRLNSASPTCFSEEVGMHATTVSIRYKIKNQGVAEKHENAENIGSMAAANAARPFQITVTAADDASKVFLSKRAGDLKGTVLAKVPAMTDMVDVCFQADPPPQSAPAPTLLSVVIDHREKAAMEALERQTNPDRETVVRSTTGDKPDMAVETFMEFSGQVSEELKSVEYLRHVHSSLQHLELMLLDVSEASIDMLTSQTSFVVSTETMSQAVWVWSMFTASIVVVTYMYQYHSIKNFLLQKKLV